MKQLVITGALVYTGGRFVQREVYVQEGRIAQLAGDHTANDYLDDKLSLEELLTGWEEQAEDFAMEVLECRIYD